MHIEAPTVSRAEGFGSCTSEPFSSRQRGLELCPRMEAPVHPLELTDADLRIDPGGVQVHMPEQGLDVPQVRPALEQVGCAGVPEAVEPEAQPRGAADLAPADIQPDLVEPLPEAVEPDGLAAGRSEQGPRLADVALQELAGGRAERDHAGALALAGVDDDPLLG